MLLVPSVKSRIRLAATPLNEKTPGAVLGLGLYPVIVAELQQYEGHPAVQSVIAGPQMPTGPAQTA